MSSRVLALPAGLLLLLALAALQVSVSVSATEVQLCGEPAARRAKSAGGDDDDLKDSKSITVTNCDKPPCRLRRKTTTNVEFRFSPDEDVKTLRNEVNANILGIPFPFLGVDNTNACSNIYTADGKTKASCPLKAGQEYVYKNKFDILEIYPKVKVVVHWALVAPNDKRHVCFNVPARITS